MHTPTTALARNGSEDDLPVVTIVEITDPTAAGESIEVIDQDLVKLHSKGLRAQRVVIRLEFGVVVYQSTNLPVRARSRVRPDLVAFVCFGPQAQGTFNAVTVRPDLLLAAEPGTDGEFVVQAGYESVSFFVPPGVLRNHVEIRQPGNDFHLPQGIEVLQANVPAAREMFGWGKRLSKIAMRQPDLFDGRPSSRAAASIQLFETLLAAVGSTKHYEPTREERTRQSRSRIVQIAEEYAMTHTAERVSVTELCEAGDVSERTLQYAFKEVMGMTPVAFLTRLRLHRVRRALREATYGTTTVSTEALRWGFWHFGEFSRAYKNGFSELPSATLKRPSEQNLDDTLSG